MKYDVVVIGAGLSGLTIAERFANDAGKKVLVIDKRNHIGGNVYDYYDDNGILIHKYGPHIFHTNHDDVFEYLSRFTEWRDFAHFVLASIDGKLVPLPVTIDTVNAIFGIELDAEGMEKFLQEQAVAIDEIKTSEDVALSKVGPILYEKIFKNYTTKQWGVSPDKLDTSVISRIPVRFNHDTRYFADKHQGMPLYGYTKMCEKMADSKNISFLLNTDYKDVINDLSYDTLVVTGKTDEFYDYCYGKMTYRSLEFVFETYDMDEFQPAPVVNYPNEHEYTRITEFKKLTGQKHEKTVICKEIPGSDGEPYYPFPTKEYQDQFEQYRKRMSEEKDVFFLGRLAEYKYYNMDATVKSALSLYDRIKNR